MGSPFCSFHTFNFTWNLAGHKGLAAASIFIRAFYQTMFLAKAEEEKIWGERKKRKQLWHLTSICIIKKRGNLAFSGEEMGTNLTKSTGILAPKTGDHGMYTLVTTLTWTSRIHQITISHYISNQLCTKSTRSFVIGSMYITLYWPTT